MSFFHATYERVSTAKNVDRDLIGLCLTFCGKVGSHHGYPRNVQDNPGLGHTANPRVWEVWSLEIGNSCEEEQIPPCKVKAETRHDRF